MHTNFISILVKALYIHYTGFLIFWNIKQYFCKKNCVGKKAGGGRQSDLPKKLTKLSKLDENVWNLEYN